MILVGKMLVNKANTEGRAKLLVISREKGDVILRESFGRRTTVRISIY
jgi:hypothetical protein